MEAAFWVDVDLMNLIWEKLMVELFLENGEKLGKTN